MIKEDEDFPGANNTMPNFTENFIRVLPSLSEAYTNPVASALKVSSRNTWLTLQPLRMIRCTLSCTDSTSDKFCTTSKHALLPNYFGYQRYNSYAAIQLADVVVGKLRANQLCGTQ
jgi:hypothetical protein